MRVARRAPLIEISSPARLPALSSGTGIKSECLMIANLAFRKPYPCRPSLGLQSRDEPFVDGRQPRPFQLRQGSERRTDRQPIGIVVALGKKGFYRGRERKS